MELGTTGETITDGVKCQWNGGQEVVSERWGPPEAGRVYDIVKVPGRRSVRLAQHLGGRHRLKDAYTLQWVRLSCG